MKNGHGFLRDLPIAALCLILRAYKIIISPLLPSACRFYPSCSEYAQEALKKHGLIKGSALAAKRLSRCHSFSKGGIDEVPEPKL